jgi:hypothetical protein
MANAARKITDDAARRKRVAPAVAAYLSYYS